MTVALEHADALAWIRGRDPRSWAALLIDQSYGTEDFRRIVRGKFNGERIANDTDTHVRDGILEWWGDGAAAVFGSWKVPPWGRPHTRLIWDKGLAAGMGDSRSRGNRTPRTSSCTGVDGTVTEDHR